MKSSLFCRGCALEVEINNSAERNYYLKRAVPGKKGLSIYFLYHARLRSLKRQVKALNTLYIRCRRRVREHQCILSEVGEVQNFVRDQKADCFNTLTYLLEVNTVPYANSSHGDLETYFGTPPPLGCPCEDKLAVRPTLCVGTFLFFPSWRSMQAIAPCSTARYRICSLSLHPCTPVPGGHMGRGHSVLLSVFDGIQSY